MSPEEHNKENNNKIVSFPLSSAFPAGQPFARLATNNTLCVG